MTDSNDLAPPPSDPTPAYSPRADTEATEPQAAELQTERSRLRRAHQRGHYDRDTLYAVIDAQPVCHLAFVRDGAPVVIPTLAWREGDSLYWHGSSASRALRASDNAEVCLTFTLVDGMVLARSGFHHSVNFRSAMVFGTPTDVTAPDDKVHHLDAMIDGMFPGRSSLLRPPSEKDLTLTRVQTMPIEEASVKIRDGGPIDEDEDYELPIWAGVVPLSVTTGTPIPDPRNLDGVVMPDGTADFRIG